MERHRFILSKNMISLMILILIFGLGCSFSFAADDVKAVDPPNQIIVQQTNYKLIDGVTETHLFLNDPDGNRQVAAFMTTIEPNAKAELKASYPGYYAKNSTASSRKNWDKKWTLARTTDQVKAYEDATGETVIMATNGDYFNMQTGQPLGYLIMEGNAFQTTEYTREPYFALLRDGSYVIRDNNVPADDVVEGISGPFYLVQNGEVVASLEDYDLNANEVRNSVGLKADGTVVLFEADGRQAPYSVGMSYRMMAEFLKAQGCVTALYLDGGGSATVVSRHEGETDFAIRNRPSDGVERLVADTLLLVSTETGTSSAFDHASLSPVNEYYTPGSQVQFTASGVSVTSRAARLPETGLTWTLSEDSEDMGSIDADTGEFVSNGKTGEVQV